MVDNDSDAQSEESHGSHVAGTVDADVTAAEELVETGASSVIETNNGSDG